MGKGKDNHGDDVSGNNNMIVGLGIVGNILSVVGVVICNKYITEVDGFKYMVFLSFLHFACTAIGTRLLLGLGVFTYKPAALNKVLWVALGSLLSVAFMNLNLSHNSIGFYQLSKLACIPVTLMIQLVVYGERVPKSVQLTLIPISFGVGYATVYDMDVNFLGTMYACAAVVATALAQIFTNTYQKSLDCNALQLLYHTSPLIAGGMLVLCPFFDDIDGLRRYMFTTPTLLRIALSCVFALGVNISNYLVLGKTSPLTYQVLGHMKTILIILLGFVMFGKKPEIRNVLGIFVAMLGVVAYTEVKRRGIGINDKALLPVSVKIAK
jgi:solute carrier family 35, member E3